MTSAFTVWALSLVALGNAPGMAPPVADHIIGNESGRSLPVCRAMPADAALAAVAGTVVDAKSRQPVAGATVVIPTTNARVRTDSGGRFNVAGIAAETGNIALRVEKEGYATSVINVPIGKLNTSIRLQSLGAASAGAEFTRTASPVAGPTTENRTASLTGMVSSAPTPFAAADLCEEGF